MAEEKSTPGFKLLLYHLGSALTKSDAFLKRIVTVFNASEGRFMSFETKLSRLKDDLSHIEGVEDDGFGWFKKRILGDIGKCVADLNEIKSEIEQMEGFSEEDKKVVSLEDEEIKSIASHLLPHEVGRVDPIIDLLVWLFAELKDLDDRAKKEVKDVIDPELKFFGELAVEIERLPEDDKARVAYESIKEKTHARGAGIRRLFVTLRYILGETRKLSRDEILERRDIKKLVELEEDLKVIAGKLYTQHKFLEETERLRKTG